MPFVNRQRMEKIGSVCVDSGTLMVGDPCYRLNSEHFNFDWNLPRPRAIQDSSNLALAFSTVYGDGEYAVYETSDGNILIDIAEVYVDEEDDA